ncbi:MAG TPA: SDR family NAD(P)-dependent oxidoreductase, partial [Candidatus Nanopelagicales bacterium]|nr:SDR family NAD(P)-dependent oxidoreductase [Candidatus Nanopelagicales bacterium]
HRAAFVKRLRRDDALVRDHLVDGRRVLVGVAQIEMARAAGEALEGRPPTAVRDVVWLSPVIVEGEEKELRVTLDNDVDGQLVFEVRSSRPEGEVVHAKGRLVFTPTTDAPPARVDRRAFQQRAERRLSREEIYAAYRREGLEYGPTFQCVDALWTRGREALAELRPAVDPGTDLGVCALPPALIDGALHTVRGLISAGGEDRAPPMVPFSVSEVQILGRVPARCFARAELSEARPEQGMFSFHVTLLDEEGRAFTVLRDFSVRRLKPAHEGDPALSAAGTEDGMDYRPCWQERPLIARAAAARRGRGTALILTHDRDFGLGERLAALHGEHSAVIAYLEDRYSRKGPGRFTIDLRDPADYERLIGEVGELASIHFLGGVDEERHGAHDLRALERAEERGVLSLFRLARALDALPQRSAELHVVTSGAQQVREEGPTNPFAAGLFGFTKVLSRELRNLEVSCVDVSAEELRDPALGRELAAALLEEGGSAPGEELALRRGRRLVRTLVPAILPEPERSALPLRQRGVYLLAGGAGGIGLTIAEHLARRFSARLGLLGRSALDEERARRVQAITAAGGECLYVQADISDPAQVEAAVSRVRERFGPIQGVIHSAIVLKDSTIGRLSEQALREVLAPKARGAVLLDRAVQGDPLDFFAFFSSAIAFTAAQGQANYAAASTFEDSYALFLRSRMGRPVTVFNWGFWGDTGVVATDAYRERLGKKGVESISKEEGLRAFERVLASRADQVFPMKLRPELLDQLGVDRARAARRLPEAAPSFAHRVIDAVEGFVGRSREVPGREVLEQLEQVSRLMLLRAFQGAGVLTARGERCRRDELEERLRVLPSYGALFDALLDVLRRGGFIELSGDLVSASPEAKALEGRRLGEALQTRREALLARSPDTASFLALLDVCVEALLDVLAGRVSPTDVLFPGGSKALVEKVYKGSRRTDYFNALVREAVRAGVEHLIAARPGDRIAVLEIGAGTGGTSAGVLDAIAAHGDRLTYTYTDISPSFAAHGQRSFGARYPFARFTVLDIEKEIRAQGFERGAFDIVLATNVLHATRDIRRTLRNTKELLRANGLLIINEVTEARDFATLTFGLTPGWWLFEDNLRLPHSPMLSLSGWRGALEDTGFLKVTGFGLPRGDLESAGQHVAMGESDGWVEERRSAASDAKASASAPAPRPPEPRAPAPPSRPAGADLVEALRDHLREVLAATLKMDAAEIETDTTFERYGVDSLVAMDVVERLQADFGLLPKTLLFEHITLDKLAFHLAAKHGDVVRSRLAPAAGAGRVEAVLDAPATAIAIVGVAGRFPMADDLDSFWANLRAGRVAFSEIPEDRWDHRVHDDPSGERSGSSYHRWGAFLAGVDRFDPLFFGISPREAQMMDPQERLFLETVWATLEDAGYSRAKLNRRAEEDGGSGVGVFVGIMYGLYQLLAAEAWGRGDRIEASSAYWSVANRVSYFFDFHGPSMAIDTACSSSLTAIHMACESIRRGECRAAIAGGVNLIIHPSHHAGLSRMKMLSRSPSSRAFGEGADGFVPGEGVGAVLLRPLEAAIRDGDRIHGVIKSSFINTNGKTGGYTVPSPGAQAELIEATLRKANIDPRTISYIEAQAVGSPLADPIEVVGLTRAFEQFTADKGFCALGSVKPNIGHLEAASGMAQLTKVLLQLRHRQIAPTLYGERINPLIDFASSPFFVQGQLSPWAAPDVIDPATGRRAPRRAGISSFGAGGANAHLIVEEYIDPDAIEEAVAIGEDRSPQVIVLSARKPEQLREQARQLRDALARTSARDGGGELTAGALRASLADIAYTLQTGREAMAARLAVIASDLSSLERTLGLFVEGREAPPNVLTGVVKRSDKAAQNLAEEMERAISARWLESIAEAWIRGADVPWERLHEGRRRRRVSLPSYAFARERCWLDRVEPQSAEADVPAPTPPLPPQQVQAPTPPSARETAVSEAALLRSVQAIVIKHITELLNLKASDVDLDEPMSDYGFDSISLTRLASLLSERFAIDLRPPVFFEHPTIGSLTERLVAKHGEAVARAVEAPRAELVDAPSPASAVERRREAAEGAAVEGALAAPAAADDPIAIIGMAGRFPGSPDLESFWDNLIAGKDLITEVPADRFDWRSIYGDPLQDPNRIRSKWGGFMGDIDRFDPSFFNISPREARSMDPQHRLFLETVWKTIEDAGYRPSDLAGTSVGIFAGIGSSEYAQMLAASEVEIDGQAATGNSHSMVANRISFLLDLRGPSEPIDTACSSSLIAVHRAIQTIRSGECELAIAGGVNLLLAPEAFLAFGKSGMLSPEGRCKTFDDGADGYVRGEGVAALLLKPLRKALADGDTIHAIIRGSGVNHGGRANSLTAPNPNAQAELLRRTYLSSGVPIETVSYVEAHGTGTALGDPIEINALKKAFGELHRAQSGESSPRKHCGLGSVKTNIGHLETAAGIAGLVKVILAMKHRRLPPLLHFQQLNQHIDL